MATGKRVLLIGLEPSVVDYTAFPDLDADKVRAGLAAQLAELRHLGFDAEDCLTDTGETAEAVVRAHLARGPWDCIVIGAGVRTGPPYFLLFERLVNVVHAHAPQAKICFNTRPTDTIEAVRRWT
jgi:hypothetical protein